MTLVLSVHSRKSMWMLTDRRLSYGNGQVVKDDAVKVVILETLDGTALLGYAGLGRTARRTEPSEWMSAAIRGYRGITLEQALSVLVDAAARELPKHLKGLPGGHVIIAPAFVSGEEPRIYTIGVTGASGGAVPGASQRLTFLRHQREPEPGSRQPRIAVAGTGGAYLLGRPDANRPGGWAKKLLHLVNAHDKGKISDAGVSDYLASLNDQTYRALGDGSVGPRCIVVSRRRPEFQNKMPGGELRCYTGLVLDTDFFSPPNINNGMDMKNIANVMFDYVVPIQDRWLDDPDAGPDKYPIDEKELNRRMGQAPHEPDGKLR